MFMTSLMQTAGHNMAGFMVVKNKENVMTEKETDREYKKNNKRLFLRLSKIKSIIKKSTRNRVSKTTKRKKEMTNNKKQIESSMLLRTHEGNSLANWFLMFNAKSTSNVILSTAKHKSANHKGEGRKGGGGVKSSYNK